MLTWIAASTSSIAIATRVLGVPYRPPSIVAKVAATLDRLSGGRLILGMGGGYSDAEFRAFGLKVPTPRAKIEGLEEAVLVARGLWSQPDFTFDGRHYRTAAANLEPKPPRRIPVWLGTFGPRALEVTGRVADGWIPSLDMAPPEAIPAMRERIFDAARSAGRDPGEIRLVYNIEVRVGSGHPNPSVVSGSAAAVAERLAGLTELGFKGMNLMPVGQDPAEQVALLGREVLPVVRAEV